ncbi:hypothetical protein C9374_006259 [Naegleria lovaniensis]|uniref:F-box domain-containing protein n=1 Tax=Naegleria lovaniensis TaxID=51637 RepID=A0AA88GNP2_NAELO|nr:uncharacterized protein C9374_006259 [Naegleria lovaniensis]KAG2381270.1 hypothetical protein C9374_006259 [Naegleria lovaniensis]
MHPTTNKKKKRTISPSSSSVETFAETNSSATRITDQTEETRGGFSSPFTNSDNINGPFIDDIIFEILHFLDSLFIIQICMKISKQWRLVSFQIPLSLSFEFGFSKQVREPIKLLASCECLKNLTSLNLVDSGIDSEGVKYIADSECLKNLNSLDLSETLIDNEGVKCIATSEYLKNLTYLDLYNNGIDNEGVKYIAHSEWLKNLTSLDLNTNGISNEGVKYIANSAYLKNLTYLNLESNRIGDEGVEYMANIECLKEKVLNGNISKTSLL